MGTILEKVINELTLISFFRSLNISKLIQISNNITTYNFNKEERIIKKSNKAEKVQFIKEEGVKLIEDGLKFNL